MKRLICTTLLFVSLAWSCKKDKSLADHFNMLTRADIEAQAQKLTNNPMESPKIGNIIFYKTDLNNYGKLLVEALEYPNHNFQLTFKFVTFKADGTVLAQGDNITTSKAGALFNLDIGAEVLDNSADFKWDISVETPKITPLSTAVFYVSPN